MTDRPARSRTRGAPARSPSLFVQSLHEVLAPLGRIEARAMFSGHGIYHEGVMLALVVRDTLYLKVDTQTQADFDALQLPPFCYQRQGALATIPSFRQAPEGIFDDAEMALAWARRAYEAALRAQRARPPRVRRPNTAAPPASKATGQRSAARKTPR
ncbi:TfoX/Sxy family protein [Pseudacidovorax intermedius]|uniref:TfoX/Sxy family protein n=1 Tax=Pseudacidovorax intermedius TaxID=433924 RepID=UPI00069EAEEE|nr:TfoX/Sxy family protein [Pseudacidovorax intermedius]